MKRAWEITQLAFVWLLLGIAFLTLYRVWAIIAVEIHSQKDFLDVASAVGTCAAVIVALYLASAEHRRRATDDISRAKLTAVAVIVHLRKAHSFITTSRDMLANEADHKYAGDHFRGQVGSFDKNVRLCTDDEIHALVPLPNHCAANLASANARFELAVSCLQQLSHGVGTEQSRREFLQFVLRLLDEVLAGFDSAISTCATAARGFDLGPIATSTHSVKS